MFIVWLRARLICRVTADKVVRVARAAANRGSPATYVTANADQTYMFADDLHPTTRLHALFAQFVEQQIASSGLGH